MMDGKRVNFILAAVMYNLVCTNDITSGLMLDAHNMLQKNEMYKRSIKAMANRIEQARRKYEKRVNYVMREASWSFSLCNDIYYDEELQKDIEVLYFQFKNELDKKGIQNSDVIARMELARSMLDYSARQFDTRCRAVERDCKMRINDRLQFLDLHGLSSMYDSMMDMIHIGCAVDFNTEMCRKAFDIVINKLADGERIARAMEAIDEENELV